MGAHRLVKPEKCARGDRVGGLSGKLAVQSAAASNSLMPSAVRIENVSLYMKNETRRPAATFGARRSSAAARTSIYRKDGRPEFGVWAKVLGRLAWEGRFQGIWRHAEIRASFSAKGAENDLFAEDIRNTDQHLCSPVDPSIVMSIL